MGREVTSAIGWRDTQCYQPGWGEVDTVSPTFEEVYQRMVDRTTITELDSGRCLLAEVDDQLETESIGGPVERVETWGDSTGL